MTTAVLTDGGGQTVEEYWGKEREGVASLRKYSWTVISHGKAAGES